MTFDLNFLLTAGEKKETLADAQAEADQAFAALKSGAGQSDTDLAAAIKRAAARLKRLAQPQPVAAAVTQEPVFTDQEAAELAKFSAQLPKLRRRGAA
jgi:hypothetical protein